MSPQIITRPDDKLTLSLVGHATVLINMYGKRILTDPVLFDKIGLEIGKGKIGLTRLTPPSIEIKDIPQLDYVVLSHAHMDHWDLQSLRELTKQFP